MPEGAPVFYWDASAILSVLVHDAHSSGAAALARRRATHLVSTLAYAEVSAVLSRLERERALPSVLADAARAQLRDGGPWRRLHLQPDLGEIDGLAGRWPLRGADLWHLATAVTLSRELPELQLATYDARLSAASAAVGLALPN